ncbi:flagellar protein FlaG [Bacillus niameyensis]|uniref:flagellar protein FlaG n=1 Tax=Bacillus niameyensis TaxID=1522308 RepID=UPI0008410360|nr:flagellar protein FlaG [Bacillus niameyensis]
MVGQVGAGQSATSSQMNGVTTRRSEEVPTINKQNQQDGVIAQEANQKLQNKVNPKEELEKVVNGMNDFLKASPNTHLKFQFHDELNEYYVTIIDDVTKEIVREIPPKKMLDMFAAMTEYIGLMVDKKI